MKADDLIKLLRSCATTSCPEECPYASDLDTCECRIMNAAADALEDYRRKISVMIGMVLDLARDKDVLSMLNELEDPSEAEAYRDASNSLISIANDLAKLLMEKGE